ncbi:hypothetical protein D0T50_00980 [Bacteroides sp. 214]|uniref:hypothetical protein n=1 Tax=Bacteroides sp. 214 TaxID=2302935 RepID=UPI0013D73596|nr:hypothetical protein [Bacteroides sp. 214]NDW11462.1 hypothetical protein [Bacteroides sp. 214]
MYNEQLENLINAALSDGELTEKEKQVLFRKAESFGIDLDEFEMVLDARLYEKQQAMKQNSTSQSSAAPKSNKIGDVKKCPACGAILQSFSIQCSDCGYNFSNIEANTSIQKLFQMLNEAENERKDAGMSVGKVIGKVFAQHFGLSSGDKVQSKKITIISNFPIPNTKEDILEFLSLAYPKAQLKGSFLTRNNPENVDHNAFVAVWRAKCEQIIMKARFSMKDDKKLLDEINRYAEELNIK